jgi:hypothetical protein
VAHLRTTDLPRIDEELNPVRAAISMVSAGLAKRVVIYAVGGEQILPAARLLARSAGVTLTPSWTANVPGCDLVITPGETAHA